MKIDKPSIRDYYERLLRETETVQISNYEEIKNNYQKRMKYCLSLAKIRKNLKQSIKSIEKL